MDSNNVILFPKKNVKSSGLNYSVEEIEHNVEMMKHYHIQETIANIAPMIFNHLDISGFTLSEEDDLDDLKDGAFVIESLRSLMCKYYGINHPFQKLAENVFIPDQNEDGVLKIVDKLDINLKKSEET